MEITTTTIHELKWDFPDTNEFNATITNGKITELHFQDVGDSTTSDLCSTNEKYLRNIYKALKGLFLHLDEIRNVGNRSFTEEDDDILLDKQLRREINSLSYNREDEKKYGEKVFVMK